MFRRRIDISASKIVWRMTATDVVAVDIDLTELTSDAKTLDLADRGWLESSHDSLHGLRLCETPLDLLPKDLIEAFVRARR